MRADDAKKNTPVANADSSDEEVDELEIAKDKLNLGNIKEGSETLGTHGEDKKKGFGFEEDKVHEDAPKQKQKSESITFTKGKPTFNKRKAGNFAEFEDGLADLDDEGQVKEKKDQKPKQDGGQREFVNLGSSAKQAGQL